MFFSYIYNIYFYPFIFIYLYIRFFENNDSIYENVNRYFENGDTIIKNINRFSKYEAWLYLLRNESTHCRIQVSVNVFINSCLNIAGNNQRF